MLKVERVSKHFGGVYANRDVSLEVAEGELRGVIGPNGAGKSTLFNLIAGHLRPTPARSAWPGRTSTGCHPTSGRAEAWRSCSRAPGCSRACRCCRT